MAYNATPLRKIRAKYQEKINNLISEFEKEVQSEIERQHKEDENKINLISFNLFGRYGIWVYANQETYDSDSPMLKLDEPEFMNILEKIQSVDCFKTRVILKDIEPRFTPDKSERLQALQEKYKGVKNLLYYKEDNSVTFNLNTVIFTIKDQRIDYKGDKSEISPEVIVPLLQEVTMILLNL